MNYTVRPYHITDFPAIYRICVSTADNGNDISSLLKDPDLHPHYYAGPYIYFEPELCFLLIIEGFPVGYILGTSNTLIFREKCEESWFPLLRKRYPSPEKEDRSLESNLIRLIHLGVDYSETLYLYPAHLHIDLLPPARGCGAGNVLMEHFCDKLRDLGVSGLHLGVSKSNFRALKFYNKTGFKKINDNNESLILGKLLA